MFKQSYFLEISSHLWEFILGTIPIKFQRNGDPLSTRHFQDEAIKQFWGQIVYQRNRVFDIS